MINSGRVLFSSTNHPDKSSARQSPLLKNKISPGENKENEDVRQAELEGDTRHEEKDT